MECNENGWFHIYQRKVFHDEFNTKIKKKNNFWCYPVKKSSKQSALFFSSLYCGAHKYSNRRPENIRTVDENYNVQQKASTAIPKEIIGKSRRNLKEIISERNSLCRICGRWRLYSADDNIILQSDRWWPRFT